MERQKGDKSSLFSWGLSLKYLNLMVHPSRFERETSAFGGQRSIQLSYGCIGGCIVHQIMGCNREISAGSTKATLQQMLGVGVFGSHVSHVFHAQCFNDFTKLHHRDILADMPDHCEVVADHQVGEFVLGA